MRELDEELSWKRNLDEALPDHIPLELTTSEGMLCVTYTCLFSNVIIIACLRERERGYNIVFALVYVFVCLNCITQKPCIKIRVIFSNKGVDPPQI